MGEARQRGTYAQRVEQARARAPGRASAARHRAAALVGVAAGEFFQARFQDGRLADPSIAVVPLYRQTGEGRAMAVIGTGFFVAPSTIVTARHVAESALAPDAQGNPGLWAVQFNANQECLPRAVVHAALHPTTDIALCVLTHMTHDQTGAALSNPALRLSARDPAIGEHVYTYAYPDTVFSQEGERGRLDLNPHFYDGHIVTHYPDGRDRVMLPFPSFETSIHIHGGASGGPVFDAGGAVVGINVSSLREPDTDCSFIAKVRDAFDLPLPVVFVAGELEQLTLRELADRGFAQLDTDSPIASTGGAQ
ncbi:serine protease [Burkholderia ambifaria]|uniref:S1 family peptidase n=1 Tax=Burkholderia ambifaria TaxID=152480 RepID=UPI000CFEB24F|nr:serine protease [Burkholderia ambifaria]MBR8186580.1 trypsin-like peptidase domain-containing protein [Burkholderia ambifaria]PRF98003.1 serine protease [Burkholderia ambifaria]